MYPPLTNNVLLCLQRYTHRVLWFQMSKRNELITNWIKANKPNGLGKLSIETGIPTGSLSQIRAGREIQDVLKRASLARVLGVSESELFPSSKGKSRASA
jgi:hypothetical protein